MAIVFPDHVGCYYLPDSIEFQNLFRSPSSSQHSLPGPTLPKLTEKAELERRRILEYEYKDHAIKPKVTTSKVGSSVTIQRVDTHPIKKVEGKAWAVIQYEYPPEHGDELAYQLFLDKALMENLDAIVIEPFTLGQKIEQWQNIFSIIHRAMGVFSSVSLIAAFHSAMKDDRGPYVGMFSIIILELYRKWIYGDPIAYYRNFDFEGDKDMDFMFHMAELLDVHSRFTHIIVRDARRARIRLSMYRWFLGIQMGLLTYKYAFGLFLKYYFPDRII